MTYPLDQTIMRKYLRTKDDANDFYIVLDHLTNNLFAPETTVDQMLLEQASYQKTTLFKQLAKTARVNLQDKTQLQLFLNEVKNFLTTLPVVTLTVAIEPKEVMITAIHDWFSRNYKTLVLLDIMIDSTIIGGTLVRFNGHYADYSLKKSLEEMETQGLN